MYISTIPRGKIEIIAHFISPDILAFYESEEGQGEFEKWKKQREAEHMKTEQA